MNLIHKSILWNFVIILDFHFVEPEKFTENTMMNFSVLLCLCGFVWTHKIYSTNIFEKIKKTVKHCDEKGARAILNAHFSFSFEIGAIFCNSTNTLLYFFCVDLIVTVAVSKFIHLRVSRTILTIHINVILLIYYLHICKNSAVCIHTLPMYKRMRRRRSREENIFSFQPINLVYRVNSASFFCCCYCCINKMQCKVLNAVSDFSIQCSFENSENAKEEEEKEKTFQK